MQKETIFNSIDNNIIKDLKTGISVNAIQSQLALKINKFSQTLKKDNEVDLQQLLKLSFEELSPIRTRYGVTYIKHTLQRIEDLNWLIKNKYKFPKLSNSQIFNLIKLKYKLSKENSIPF